MLAGDDKVVADQPHVGGGKVRLLDPAVSDQDGPRYEDQRRPAHPEPSLRPQCFADYPGQRRLVENMQVYVQAAKNRGRPLDHVLLHGPPGLGKTTLAHIIARELEVPFYATSGPALDKPRDIVGVLTGLEERALLFIDEIHRLMVQAEEILYTAMEDHAVDLIVGEAGSARSVRISVPPFTLVGATTKASKLSRPLMSRFGIQEKVEYYSDDDLVKILSRSAHIFNIEVSRESLYRIAQCARGTPRIAHRLLRRVQDFAEVNHGGQMSPELVHDSLKRLGIDPIGLDRMDNNLLKMVRDRFGGGPVGIESLAMGLGEDPQTLEDIYEPYLVFKGYLARTARGRVLTQKGKDHL